MKKTILIGIIVSFCIGAVSMGIYKGYKKSNIAIEASGKDSVKQTDLFAKTEFIKVLKKMKGPKTIQSFFTTKLTANNGNINLGSFDGIYILDNGKSYIKSYESESLINGKYKIAIEHETKSIFIEENTENIESIVSGLDFLYQLDSFVNLEDSIVQYKQIDKNTALLSIELGYSQYYKAELIYNINTKVIQQMNLYPYSELFTQIEEGEISNQITINSGIIDNEIVPERIELIYKSIRFDEDVDSKWFDESKIFKLKDNKIILNSKYQNYEIEY